MRLDTFTTVKYKSCFIHAKFADGKESMVWQTPDHAVYRAKTWQGAQRAITRYEKERDES